MEYVYATPAEEFQLAQLNLNGNTDFNAAPARSLELLLLVEGAVRLEAAAGQTQCRLVRGESVMIPACLPGYRIHGAGQVFRAAVPSRSNP